MSGIVCKCGLPVPYYINGEAWLCACGRNHAVTQTAHVQDGAVVSVTATSPGSGWNSMPDWTSGMSAILADMLSARWQTNAPSLDQEYPLEPARDLYQIEREAELDRMRKAIERMNKA